MTAGAATAVDVALVQICLQLLSLHPSIALACAMCVGAAGGMSVNFFLSRRFVFASDGRRPHQQFLTFFAVSLSTAMLRLAIAYGLVSLLSLALFAPLLILPVSLPAERLAHLGAVGIVTIYSFLAHRHFSFAGGFRSRLLTRTTMVS
ncbi:GtrA family protein [Devosia lucknowensis]|nr:GtrA family protein [Devosia lucknowensis]